MREPDRPDRCRVGCDRRAIGLVADRLEPRVRRLGRARVGIGEECQELPERLECGPTLRNSRRGPVEQQPLAPGRPEVAEGRRPARQHQVGETGLDQAQHDHLVGLLAEQQRAPIMSLLPSGLLAAFLPQALCLRLTGEAIRRRWQMTIMAIFLQSVLQRLHLLSQQRDLLLQQLNLLRLLAELLVLQVELLLLHPVLFPQRLILLSKQDQFFFYCHAATVSALALLYNLLGLLYSYLLFLKCTRKISSYPS